MTSPEAIRAAAADSVRGTATHEPRELDILCGKETKARNHKGSKCFRIFVDRYRKRYQEANNKHKRGEITKEMYLTITQANIRFLKFNDELNGWVEIGSTEARDKITHALRFAQKRTSRKNKKNVPQRQGSDSTHRSETSNTTATSYDWDQLLQTQQHLAGLSLGNMSSSLRASRSSFSSTGSASLLSKGDSSHGNSSSGQRRHNNHRRGGGGGGSSSVSSARSKSSRTAANNSKSSKSKPTNQKGVSFEPSVCSSTTTGGGGLATIFSASTKSSSESIPLPVDLSSTQHFDMHQSAQQTTNNLLGHTTDGTTATAAGAAAGAAAANQPQDRPPRMPSRPTEETEAEDTDDTADDNNNNNNHHHHHLNDDDDDDDDEFDTIMNSANTGFGEMLDPLLEIDQEENMRDSDSHSSASGNDTDDDDDDRNNNNNNASISGGELRQPMVAPNGDLLPRVNSNNNQSNLEPININVPPVSSSSTSLHLQQQAPINNNLMLDGPIISNDSLLEAVGENSILDGFADMNIDHDDPEGQEMLSESGDFQSFGTTAPSTTNAGGLGLQNQQHQQHTTTAFHPPNHHLNHHNSGTGDYSQLLMQEPLWEWEPQSRGKK